MQTHRLSAEIIAVGSELLLGQIANTNAQFISGHLSDVGVNVFHHVVVGDNPDRLKQTIAGAAQRSDIIFITGGLGPTKDDLTKQTVAEFLDKELIYDQPSLGKISRYFENKGETMTENNRRQALVIEDARVLANHKGMAPGMDVQHESKRFILLPGPPSELYPMFLQEVKPHLGKQGVDKITSRVLRFYGIGESALETELMDLIDHQSNPTIAPLAKDGEVTLRLTATGPDAHTLLDELENTIAARVGHYFYGYGETGLAEVTFELIKSKQWTVAAAESLTAGWFAKTVADFPGASSVLKGGVVCYSNEMKTEFLKVHQQTIQEKGAVSRETAEQMAANIRRLSGADIGISFTGVAGPESSEGHSAGTVFIALATSETVEVFPFLFQGDRQKIRSQCVKKGWDLIRRKLLGLTPFGQKKS